MKRVGILGYGSVGQFLADRILHDPVCAEALELAFVWNRSAEKLDDDRLPEQYRMTGDLKSGFQAYLAANEPGVDILVEVAHPGIVSELGAFFLQYCDLFVTSATALADLETESSLLRGAVRHGLYIPTGAGWGVSDIRKMDLLGSLQALEVTMQFSAQALRLNEPMKSRLATYVAADDQTEPLVLHRGNIREIARWAPNNVNTMICLALAGRSVGLDNTVGCLVAQKAHDAHIIDIKVTGPDGFQVETTRYNPAKKDAVTGAQTYGSFLISLIQAGGQGAGLHFC